MFSLRITFTDRYPENPPKVRFTGEMYHPNGRYRCRAYACMHGTSSDGLEPVHAQRRLHHPSLPCTAVYTDGTLCMDLLQDQWSPCHNICTLLTSIQSLLTDPNCASPANPEAAQMYLKERTAYNKRVRKISQKSVEG